jgi:hypothetical protein
MASFVTKLETSPYIMASVANLKLTNVNGIVWLLFPVKVSIAKNCFFSILSLLGLFEGFFFIVA